MLDDEHFRDYESKENQEILRKIQKGFLPAHLKEKYRGVQIALDFLDKRKETWREKPASFVPFSGEGVSIISTAAEAEDHSLQEEVVSHKDLKEEVIRVRIVMADGKSQTLEFDKN